MAQDRITAPISLSFSVGVVSSVALLVVIAVVTFCPRHTFVRHRSKNHVTHGRRHPTSSTT
jgi:hypothetical protein